MTSREVIRRIRDHHLTEADESVWDLSEGQAMLMVECWRLNRVVRGVRAVLQRIARPCRRVPLMATVEGRILREHEENGVRVIDQMELTAIAMGPKWECQCGWWCFSDEAANEHWVKTGHPYPVRST